MEQAFSELLRAAGIAADPIAGPRAGSGTIYTMVAPDAATRDAWLAALATRAASGWHALILGADAFSDEKQPVDDAALGRTLERAARTLEQLDRYQAAPAPGREPDRVRALLAFQRRHPEGAPLAELLRALRDAPESDRSAPPPREAPPDRGEPEPEPSMLDGELAVGLFPARDGAEVLARYGFGNFNACPSVEHHVARAQRWARDHGARLDYLGPDRYGFALPAPPADAVACQRIADEQSQLAADERPPPGALHRLTRWRFWWD